MTDFLILIGVLVSLPFVFGLFRAVRYKIVSLWRETEKPEQHQQVEQPSAMVLLVHGTFAKNAPWTFADSPLNRALRTRFGQKLQIERENWSGKNSFKARRKGAAIITEKIAAMRNANPSVPLYLVGHSHGGNVCLSASMSQNPPLAEGVVCLATPVLTTKRRRFARDVRIMIAIGVFFLCVLPFTLNAGEELNWWQTAGSVAGMGLACAWYFYAGPVIRKVTEPRRYYRLDYNRTAFIRSPFDEASGVIGLVNTLSWLVNKLIRGPFELYESFARPISAADKRAAVMSYLPLIGIGLFLDILWELYPPLDRLLMSDPVYEEAFLWFAGSFYVIGLLGLMLGALAPLFREARSNKFLAVVLFPIKAFVIFFGALLLVPAIVLVSALQGLAVGWELLICSIYVEVTAEPSPAGRWRLYQLKPPPEGALRHSSVYADDAGIDAVCLALEEMGCPLPENEPSPVAG